jgi:hypothetical protein
MADSRLHDLIGRVLEAHGFEAQTRDWLVHLWLKMVLPTAVARRPV